MYGNAAQTQSEGGAAEWGFVDGNTSSLVHVSHVSYLEGNKTSPSGIIAVKVCDDIDSLQLYNT